MKTLKEAQALKVTKDVDWKLYPHAAKWIKKLETEEKKRIASEHKAKKFEELEKRIKGAKKLEELYESLEARTRGRVNYYLHKNKELGRICFLKLTGNDNEELLHNLDKLHKNLEKADKKSEKDSSSSSSMFHIPCYS